MAWIPVKSRAWRIIWALAGKRIARREFKPEHLEGWAQFYESEADGDEGHSLEDYAQTIFRFGLPDVGNPFPQGEERHYRIHPGGFLSGEIERALRPAEIQEEAEKSKSALDRIGLLLHLGCPMRSARAYWADEDVKFACALALAEGGWERAGAKAPNAILFAMEERLIEPMLVPGLLIARKLIEEAKYPPPWRGWGRRGEPERKAAPESEPPRRIELERWRGSRADGAPAPAEESANVQD